MNILIIDEASEVAHSLHAYGKEIGCFIYSASSLAEGLAICQKNKEYDIDIVFVRDIISGTPTCYSIQDLKSSENYPEVLIYTELGNAEHIEIALQGGAWDYIVGIDSEQILSDALRRVVRFRHSTKKSSQQDHQAIVDHQGDYGIIGSSSVIQNCLDLVSRIARSDASVLITGETGTGKEVFASAIHSISDRSSSNMTVVDCAALPTTLVESILFGHTKGSFTGADKRQAGLVKQADGGSLFLDEIGEMPLEIQKKFLRVLQENEYLPVGSRTPEHSDFRLIAATNKNLDEMVDDGSFRQDLLYRLKTFQLELPPLRERQVDKTELAYHFRDRICKREKLKKKKLSTDYLTSINAYDWPGNVRELYQTIESSMIEAADSTVLESTHLPMNIRLAITKKRLKTHTGAERSFSDAVSYENINSMPTLKEYRELAIQEQEKNYLVKLVHLYGGDMKRCCQTAGLSRSRLYDLLKKHGLSKNKSTLRST